MASLKATRQEQAALIAGDPGTFGVPAYVGQHGWVSIQPAAGRAGWGVVALGEAGCGLAMVIAHGGMVLPAG